MRTRILLPVGMALVLAACSPDSGSSSSSTSKPATPATPAPAPESTPAPTPTPEPPPPSPPPGGTFSYDPVGQLTPASAGTGDADPTVVADIRFPLKCAPAYANSQLYNAGGMYGGGGGFCDDSNYKYPWHDNFCEKRATASQTSWMCPTYSGVHQGQDIRANTQCSNKNVTFRRGSDGLYKTDYPIVAVEDGVISYIGSYSVYLDVLHDGEPERKYTYLHMEMAKVHMLIHQGDTVTKGQLIGYLSNQFHNDGGGNPIADETTPHLHFEIQTSAIGTDGHSHFTFVSPYMTLVTAYQRLLAAGNAGDCPN